MAAVNYEAQAEKVIKSLIKEKTYKNKNGEIVEKKEIYLTTGQITKFLSIMNSIGNKVSIFKAENPEENKLPDELVEEIQYMRIKLIYQAGREKSVKEFLEKSELDKYIQKIGNSVKNFNIVFRYVEALVAYHKFYGGKDV